MIRAISAAETIAVRWPILRPGFARETAVFDGDEAPSTLHFGAFDGGALVGVASIYLVPCPEKIPALPVSAGHVSAAHDDGSARDATPAFQLRGMATLPEVRGRRFGEALLATCVAAARERGAAILWCNARTSAAKFYAKNGWQIVGVEFDIPTVGPHFRMWRAVAAA